MSMNSRVKTCKMDEQVELFNLPTDNSTDMNRASNNSSSSMKKPSGNRPLMKWTEEKDIILCKEVVTQNPFQFRKGSTERGKAWSTVASKLREQYFKVDQRAIRDRYNGLQNKTKKNAEEKKASGISPEESECQRELRTLLEDLMNQEEDAELLPKNYGDEEQKRLDGQEVQKRACETFVESRKRLFGDKENTPPKQKRNSGSDAILFLHQKMELEREMRTEELSMRRAEVERKEREEERRRLEETERDQRFELLQQQQQQMQQQFLQQQQQMQQQFMQQQQQMQSMMMMFMQGIKDSNNKQ